MLYAVRHILAFAACGFLAAPNATLPCFDVACAGDGTVGEMCCVDACSEICCDVEAVTAHENASDHQPHERDSHPCECPPGCPAPCGSGKLPCTPLSIGLALASTTQFTLLQADRLDAPAFRAGDDLFRPPRS